MGWITEVADIARAITPVADPRTPEHRWQRNVFYAVTVLILVTVLHLSAAKGLFSPYIPGVVHADELKAEIQSTVEPLQDDIDDLKAEVKSNGDALRLSLKFEYAERIRDNVAARCDATTREDRARINETIERLQEQYQGLTKTDRNPDGSRYPEPDCDDL